MARHYEESHPQLSFHLNRAGQLSDDPELWALLGAAQAKCEQLAASLIEPGSARKLYDMYLAKGVAATTQIEGNPLDEEDAMHVVRGEPIERHDPADFEQQQQNIVKACNEMAEDLQQGRPLDTSVERFRYLNRLVLENTHLDEDTVPGSTDGPAVLVRVYNYHGAPREDREYLLQELDRFLNSDQFRFTEWLQIGRAILRAIVAHVYFVLIHPFGDGNGRTARLIEFQILLSSGVPAPACHLLTNHYNETRRDYTNELHRITTSRGNLAGFIKYALKGMLAQLNLQMQVVREYETDIVWGHFVNRQFNALGATKSRRRQSDLIGLLSRKPGPFAASRLTQMYPDVRALYQSFDPKTLTRDINALKDLGLISASGPGEFTLNRQILRGLRVPQFPARPQLEGE